MRTKIVAGNWKMNNDQTETITLIESLKNQGNFGSTRVIVAPSYVHLSQAVYLTTNSVIEVAAQNVHESTSGAYTGEVSPAMLCSVGIQTVILGHSERRAHFGESDVTLAKKVINALDHDMEIIFCFGEELEDRKFDNHFNVVKSQISNVLFELRASAWSKIVLAYEPVWAIGSGETASPEQAQEMHAFIRNLVRDKYDADLAEKVSILYGGSVKPANAQEIFSKQDVDGGLIGGAALSAADFTTIIKST
tara:strand:+ start:4228 stop:4977 length:750 start_codon:yes stop_codon:yes gene_type:complete